MKKKLLLLSLLLILFTPCLVKASTQEKNELGETINVTNHKTLTYTKEEVIKKYAESLPTYDYTKSYYEELPSFKSPYYEGVLKQEIKNDVLKQFNFYRYLAGLNEVEINEDKMQRSQKGAFINALNKELSHTPTKPNDMDQDFYEEAFAGVYAGWVRGDTYSGNVSMGTDAYDLIKDFVDDSTNVGFGVGHRSSMLDPRATAISFGFTPRSDGSPWYASGAISVYYEYYVYPSSNQDLFYAWPPAGYVPIESMPAYNNTLWSIWFPDGYEFNGDDLEFQIECLGKTYDMKTALDDDGENTIFYSIPAEMKQDIVSRSKYIPNIPIKFTIKNIQHGADTVNYEYTTTFIKATGITLDKTKLTMIKGTEDKLVATMLPNGNTPSGLVWKSKDNGIVSVDDSGNLKANAIGETTITVTASDGSSETCEVSVVDFIKGDLDEDRTISVDDAVEALYYYIEKYETTDHKLAIGDMDNDGKITVDDAVDILMLYVNK